MQQLKYLGMPQLIHFGSHVVFPSPFASEARVWCRMFAYSACFILQKILIFASKISQILSCPSLFLICWLSNGNFARANGERQFEPLWGNKPLGRRPPVLTIIHYALRCAAFILLPLCKYIQDVKSTQPPNETFSKKWQHRTYRQRRFMCAFRSVLLWIFSPCSM